MVVGSVVPVAVAASIGALATARTVRLAWVGENRVHRKLFLSLLLLAEAINLLVPLGALNHAIGSYHHRPVFALGAFLAALHLQELLSFVISYSKTWSIYAEYKSAGLVPEYFSYWNRFGRDRLFKRPLFVILAGLLVGIFLQPVGHILVFLGVLWFAGIASFLARVWPEDRVLEKIAKSWKLRIVLALVLYLVVAPLVVRAVGIQFPDYEHAGGNDEHHRPSAEEQAKFEQILRENLAKVDSFLSSYEGIAVAVLVLVYKLVVLGTVGGIRRCYWSCHHQGSASSYPYHPVAGAFPAASAAAGAGPSVEVTPGVAVPADAAAADQVRAFVEHPAEQQAEQFHGARRPPWLFFYGFPGGAAAGDRSVLEPLAPAEHAYGSTEGAGVRVPSGVPSTTAAPSAPQGYAFYA